MGDLRSHFSITLINEAKGLHQSLEVAQEEFILDAAKDQDISLPYSCCAGACFDCLGKIVEGTVEQTPQALTFLKPREIEAGYILLCSSTPTSDCTIQTHQAEELFGED